MAGDLTLRTILIVLFMAFGGLTANAAPHLVVELSTGKVISQQQAFDRWHPASLTKLMTAYTAFREVQSGRLSLLSPVKISARAHAEPPSKMGYPVDTVMTVDTAIKILMVKSANDIATAVAESVGGSVDGFVQLMNANARRLGMNDSNFVNAHGLHDPRQFTSARDLAVLATAIRKEFPKYAGYFSIPAIRSGKSDIGNHNALLARFPGTTGMKTGFVCASGLNIVVTSKRNGKELLAVVLGGPTGKERNVRAARLLTEGFSKNSFFVATRLDTLKLRGNKTPPDLRETVCSKQRKTQVKESGEDEGEDSAPKLGGIFAMARQKPDSELTLDELEAKYLLPKQPVTPVVQITLGNATGPDPFGLVTPLKQDAASVTAFAQGDGAEPVSAAASANLEWPTIQTGVGPKRNPIMARIPLPLRRPGN